MIRNSSVFNAECKNWAIRPKSSKKYNYDDLYEQNEKRIAVNIVNDVRSPRADSIGRHILKLNITSMKTEGCTSQQKSRS